MKKALLLIFFAGISLSSLIAQDSNKQLLDKLVEKEILSQDEADELLDSSSETKQESKIEQNDEGNVHNIFKNIPFVNIGGYGMLMHNYNNTAKTKHDTQIRVMFLAIRGNITNELSYFVLTELANPLLYEFYADWKPRKEFNIRAGQAKTPIGMENQLSLTILETVFNTRSISSLMGMGGDVLQLQNGRNNTGRDIGVQAYGSFIEVSDHDLMEYGVGIYQGSGVMSNDKNNSKDFAGSLLFQPIKGFRIGGSTYLGEATYLKPGDLNEAKHTRNRWIASSDFRSGPLYARAEWIYAKDSNIEKEGLTGLLQYYFVPDKFNVIGKVDYLNHDKKNNNEVIDYLVGVDYYFYNRCRVQLNYQYSDYSASWAEKDSHRVIGQLQIVF